eukprot:jgi/Chrpa1/539/Chrysochromulina_OHIO_Genome00010520-RA
MPTATLKLATRDRSLVLQTYWASHARSSKVSERAAIWKRVIAMGGEGKVDSCWPPATLGSSMAPGSVAWDSPCETIRSSSCLRWIPRRLPSNRLDHMMSVDDSCGIDDQ